MDENKKEKKFENYTAITNTFVNYRKTPSIKGASIFASSLKPGTAVEVIGEENEWLKVRCGGNEGYIYSKYLKAE